MRGHLSFCWKLHVLSLFGALPSKNSYLQSLIEKTEQFLRRIRWKAYFFLNPDVTSRTKETFAFHSTKNPPPIDELKGFEDDMLKMIQSIKFRKINNPFLLKLKNDIDRIENESKLLIPADKTTNIYKLETPVYNELLNATSQNRTKNPNKPPFKPSKQ